MKTKKIIISVLLFSIVFSGMSKGSIPSYATGGSDPCMGSIALFPYDFVPFGWLECNGQQFSVMQYQALYSLIGNTFGGDTTKFNLPDLRNASPIPGTRYCISPQGLYGFDPDTMMVGEICLLPDSVVNNPHFEDKGLLWLPCNGQPLDPANSDYADLYASIGYKFGGSGNNFNLPNLSDASPLPGLSYYISVQGCMVTADNFSTDENMGGINLFATNLLPGTSRPCNGQTIATNQFNALYSLLGTRFGGTVDNFAVPDLRGAAPLPGISYGINIIGIFPSRS